MHWSLTLAAAVMIFALGGLAGRATGGDRSHAASRITRQSSLAPAEDVQRAGTRYVETVAALAAATDTLPSETASQGRQVALSALRGAAEQLLYLPGNDRRTEQLLQELRSPAP